MGICWARWGSRLCRADLNGGSVTGFLVVDVEVPDSALVVTRIVGVV